MERPKANRPKLTTGSVKPGIILKSFGLTFLKPLLYGSKNQEGDEPLDKLSMLGTPVFASLIFHKGEYKKNGQGEAISYEGMEIVTVLLEVAQTKNIVRTVIQGRNGAAKEFINDDDFNVTIRGALVNTNPRKYPKDEVEALVQILKAQSSLSVTSDFLQLFSIHNIVISDYSLPQLEGQLNVQPFEIRAWSDEPIELTKL